MNFLAHRIFGLLCMLTLILNGCATFDVLKQQASLTTVEDKTPLPAHPFYVLAVSVGNVGHNELVVIDSTTWRVVQHIPLLSVAPANLNRDPQGRIWIGYGAEPGGDHRVQVFKPDGGLLKTLDVCEDPYNLIHFAAGRAFIPCLQSGFYAAVVVVDLQSLAIIKKIDIRIEGDIFLLLTSGGNETYFALIGNGDKTNRIALIDTHTLTTLRPIDIPRGAPFAILPYHGRFLLLNSNPDPKAQPADRQDLTIVDMAKSPLVSTAHLPTAGALWGTLESDALYTYHNIEQNGMRQDPTRAISRLNLVTNQSELWSLPERWNARDIAVVNGAILLAHSTSQKSEEDGLYRFDPVTGKLTILVNIPGAQRILPPAP